MDDKPDGTTEKQDAAGGKTNRPPPPLADEKGAAVGGQDAKNPGQVPRAEPPSPSRWMRFRRWLITPEGSGVFMVIFTAVIAFTGIVGVVLVWQGGKDTATIADAAQKQVCAANRNADAAQRFADTADDINGNINDAVGKLNDQATATGKLAGQALAQANATRSLAQTSKDALVAVQRPFVFATGFEGIRIGDPNDPAKIVVLKFSITWENSGTTPTRGMTQHYDWILTPTPLPSAYVFPDESSPTDSPFALGPKAIAHTTEIQIPATDIAKVFNKQEYLYIWGSAHYRDIFPGTKPHVTRYCTQVTGFDGDPLSRDPNTLVRTTLENCNPTCYDDECNVK